MAGIIVGNSKWRLSRVTTDIIGRMQDKIITVEFYEYDLNGNILSGDTIIYLGQEAYDFFHNWFDIRDCYVRLFDKKGFDKSLIPEEMDEEFLE